MNTDYGRCNCYSGKFGSNGKDTYSASLYETVSGVWIRKDGIAMGYPIALGSVPMQSPNCQPAGYGLGQGRRRFIQ